MVDIAPELYEDIQKRFQEKLNKAERSGSHVKDIRKKLEAGTATFRDADLYAVEVGSMLSESMMEVLKLDQMPNGQFYYNIANRTLGASLQETYGLVASVAAEVQEELNAANGIGLKAITPEANTERINGLVGKAVEATDQEALNKILKSPVENVLMSAVDDTVQANAQMQSKAGLQPIIRRATVSKCCDWCEALAGTYKYPDDVPKDVYRRHQNCRCTVEYVGAGKRQDVWSKKEDVLTKEEARLLEKKIQNSPNSYLPLTLRQPDIMIHKSVGAKSENYDVLDLGTGELYNFVEGKSLWDVEVFAGKGTKTIYRKAVEYAEEFNNDPSEWQHVKGKGILNYYGEERKAEVHWSQCAEFGKIDFFIKRWLD